MTTRERIAKGIARVFIAGEAPIGFPCDAMAYSFWLALPKGTRAAMRVAGDNRPVMPWDYADKQKGAL